MTDEEPLPSAEVIQSLLRLQAKVGRMPIRLRCGYRQLDAFISLNMMLPGKVCSIWGIPIEVREGPLTVEFDL